MQQPSSTFLIATNYPRPILYLYNHFVSRVRIFTTDDKRIKHALQASSTTQAIFSKASDIADSLMMLILEDSFVLLADPKRSSLQLLQHCAHHSFFLSTDEFNSHLQLHTIIAPPRMCHAPILNDERLTWPWFISAYSCSNKVFKSPFTFSLRPEMTFFAVE